MECPTPITNSSPDSGICGHLRHLRMNSDLVIERRLRVSCDMASKGDALKRVRKIIAAWPETSEKLSHGAPTFWGGRKTFAMFLDNHHGDGRLALWIKSNADEREQLMAIEGDTFFVPPYVGPSGWIGVRLDRGADWGMIEELLQDGYRMVAPKRALQQLPPRESD